MKRPLRVYLSLLLHDYSLLSNQEMADTKHQDQLFAVPILGEDSEALIELNKKLSTLGISNTIRLPTIVVIGDQSTGKSSVLQAITEISFPVQERTCTRFPIQISFRQTASGQNGGVKATISPGPLTEKDDAFRDRIQGFRIDREALTTEVMKEMIEKVCIQCHLNDYPNRSNSSSS